MDLKIDDFIPNFTITIANEKRSIYLALPES